MQDLQAVNEALIPIHPLVPNTYTFLTQMPGSTQYFSVLDLKDALFCIPLHPESQYLFAFEWRDPDTLEATRYTWTVLQQGFQNSPHHFGNVLAREQRELSLFIYLFIYLLATLGLRCYVWDFSTCGKWGLLFLAVHGHPIDVASLVVEQRL